jgi:hypothetical protein
MRLDEACRPAFARHETFHPRWGWIKKAFDAADQSPRVFNAEDATLRLGVGKNMVRSIRFWGHASKALTRAEDPDRPRLPLSAPSRIGAALFGRDGWDPYTEEPGTLWLLHWLLLAPTSELPVWWITFCEFNAVEFTEEQLTDFVTDQVRALSTWPQPHPSSLAKDISCLLRTYASSVAGGSNAFDDIVDCPLRELGLLRCLDATERVYRFAVGPKSTLPASIMLYASLDFLARTDAKANTVTASRLASEAGAPARTFKITESDLVDLLEEAASESELVKLARPGGVTQLVFAGPPADVATEVLRRFYQEVKLGTGPERGVFAGRSADLPSEASVAGSRAQLELEENPPSDVLKRLEFHSKRNKVGLAK